MSGWTRLRHSGAGATGKYTTTQGNWASPAFTISNGAMTLSMGNATGAMGSTAGVFGCGGAVWSCADVVDQTYSWASTAHGGGAATDVVRLDMSLGGASIAISGGNANDTEVAMSMPLGGGTLGFGYDTDSEASSSKAATSVNYSGSMGGLGVGVKTTQKDGKTGYMGSVSAPMSAGNVYVFAGKTLGQKNNYGLNYTQSLGGGASLTAGVTSADSLTTVGAGVAFSY
jgi:hypothetical protein